MSVDFLEEGMKGRIGAVARRSNAVGFGADGEQYHGVHSRLTLLGIAIGRASGGAAAAHDDG